MSSSSESFKSKIRKWKPECDCRLFTAYLRQIGLINFIHFLYMYICVCVCIYIYIYIYIFILIRDKTTQIRDKRTNATQDQPEFEG